MSNPMTRRQLRDYGPIQMADRLGLARWQIDRALADGLIPQPDVGGGRWSAGVVDAAEARLDDIRAAVGSVPDVGAGRAAEVLSQRFGRTVDLDVLVELARQDLIPEVGSYKGWPLYDGRALERFTDYAALDKAMTRSRLFTADQAAAHLQTRRCDLDHLVRAGWLEPATCTRSVWHANVPLYRAADLDVRAADPAIDWDEVRATPPGRPSPLARLTARR